MFSNAASFLGGMGTEGRMAEMPTFSLEDIALGELLKLSTLVDLRNSIYNAISRIMERAKQLLLRSQLYPSASSLG